MAYRGRTDEPDESAGGGPPPREVSRISRGAYVLAGHGCVALGVIGVFVPLMPTTIFLLLAAAAYARGSDRFYQWLLWHPRLGPYIRDFRERGGMSRSAKVTAISMLTLVLGSSIFFFVASVPIQLALGAVGLGVIGYILRVPTL